jgi:hypothetical protein
MFLRFKRIHLWLLVVVGAAWETLRHESIAGVRGPSLSELALLFVVEAVFLLFVWLELRQGSAWRKAIVAGQAVLITAGASLYFWQKSWTGRVFAAAETTLQELQVGHLAPPFREVVLTKDGLVFWCWVQTNMPTEQKKAVGSSIQSKLEEDLKKQFPSIKRVVVTAI